MIYESKKEDGKERIEVLVLDEKKIVQEIETTVVWNRVWFNDELIEDTKDCMPRIKKEMFGILEKIQEKCWMEK